ncbi:putative DBH-like monooxygenase protein 2 [Sagmatias obliquidens]|uniref:putative DBH-like monooxygenase protein 2 n=1 Tax=Sagmatias obliquidens TaxID=3371155 RepID=UPI000F43F144|nr:putative DBH-like monooxygenase protein 2 [Lagenorhynchus obliquidens]XP_026957489.1 putative DBH-like monooxygenase protein 2 [Lagenorhynchus obliquidens]
MIISSVTHTGRKNSRIRDFGPLPKEQPANDTSSLHQDKPDPSNVTFLHWDFDLEAEVVTFELQVQTAGWVGLGITNSYTMVGSNLVVGGVSPDGNVYFSNQHLVDEDALEEGARTQSCRH